MPTVGEVYHSDTLLVAPYYIWSLLSRIDTIAQWSPDSVDCCVIENSAHPCTIGCIRRTLLRSPPFENTVLREVLEEAVEGKHEWYLTLKFLHTDANAVSPITHQSLISDLRCTWRLQALPQDPNKTFVSVTARYTIATVDDSDHRDADAVAAHEISTFFQWWITTQHRSLSDYVISVAYPLIEGRLTIEHRKQYEMFEDAVVQVATRKDIPQQTAQALETLLQAWVRETKRSDEKDIVIVHLRQDVASTRRIAESLAAQQAGIVAAAQQPAVVETHAQQPRPDVEAEPVVAAASQAHDVPQPPPLSASAAETAQRVLQQQGLKMPTATDSTFPYAAPPTRFDPVLLNQVVERGKLNEAKAWKAFQQLDSSSRGWLTSEELSKVLMTVEHFGMFEDKDGTLSRIAAQREHSQRPLPTLTEERSSTPQLSLDNTNKSNTGDLTPRQRERQTQQEREGAAHRAMQRHAEKWMSKYARQQKGRLVFDEFCLLLLQLATS